jgi:hypothetical protein
MDNAFRMLSDLVSNLTSVIIGILGLGIVGSLAFGDMMGLDVIGNITSLVESLGVDANSLNVIYNAADFLNKIAFGLIIWAAAMQLKQDQIEIQFSCSLRIWVGC